MLWHNFKLDYKKQRLIRLYDAIIEFLVLESKTFKKICIDYLILERE
jgi:hypothetical protein